MRWYVYACTDLSLTHPVTFVTRGYLREETIQIGDALNDSLVYHSVDMTFSVILIVSADSLYLFCYHYHSLSTSLLSYFLAYKEELS